MKLSFFAFGRILQMSSGHEIVRRNAAPISATNLCVTDCTGVVDDWKRYSNNAAFVDGNYIFVLIFS